MKTEKIGIMPGGFNLLHSGHIKAIEYAKDHCDYLICLIIRDMSHKKHKLYQENIEDRFIKLRALRDVDEVLVCEDNESFLNMLNLLNYDVYFLDESYKESGFDDGKKLVGEDRLLYIPRRHNRSTTNEIKNIIKVAGKNVVQ